MTCAVSEELDVVFEGVVGEVRRQRRRTSLTTDLTRTYNSASISMP